MLHTILPIHLQNCISKTRFRVANCDAMPGILFPVLSIVLCVCVYFMHQEVLQVEDEKLEEEEEEEEVRHDSF